MNNGPPNPGALQPAAGAEIESTSGPGDLDILVVRGAVTPKPKYGLYRPELRRDFLYSCAYCSITECEAQAIRFTIDHYEPVSARPDLECVYTNLYYCCDQCNIRKGDLSPPEEARAEGHRFFRIDADPYSAHYTIEYTSKKIKLKGISNVGLFTIEMLDLNRETLLRLRSVRAELDECKKFAAHGISVLRRFPIDQLPGQIKAKAAKAISACISMAESVHESTEALLRDYARSHLLDDDGSHSERLRDRKKTLAKLKRLYPDSWRGRD